MRSPRVSTIIPVFNCAGSIARAVRSVLGQDQPPFEVLVVDDGSTDRLEEALEPFAGAITVLRHGRNRGAAAARNTGAEAAQGEYLAFLDSDDTWMAGKLRRQTAFVVRHGLDAACTGFEIQDGAGPCRQARRSYPLRIDMRQIIQGCFLSPGSTLLIRRRMLLALGGYDPAYRRLEDWDLLLRIAGCGWMLGNLDEPLARIRRGPRPARHIVEESLARLRDRHLDHVAETGALMARRFRSAIAFEQAAACRGAGDRLGTGLHLLRSLLLMPYPHPLWRLLVEAGRRRR